MTPEAARVVAAAAPLRAESRRGFALVCLVAAGCYYALLLAPGGNFFEPLPYGLTFNSMLQHLLQGRFDVDPGVISDEGFWRGGATYAYFGVLPALLRAPFLGLAHFATIDFTRLSCLAAVIAMAAFKIETAALVARRLGDDRAAPLVTLFIGAILMSGPQIAFLKASIYQEAAFWAAACAAAFVFLFVRGWLSPNGFSRGILAGMALAAGLCLLARVSTALGLYLALGFVCLRLLWVAARDGTLRGEWRRFIPATAIVCGFAAVAALINQERWGDPLTFVDLTRQIIALTRVPDRIARVHQYGEFNPARIGYAIGYYFCPIWFLRDAGGHLLWSAFQQRLFDFVELPPASFFISEPFLLGLAAWGAGDIVRRRVSRADVVVAAMCGLAVPVALMLCAIALTYRYRMEFYPLIELCAFVGFAGVLTAPRAAAQRWLIAAAVCGVIAAHATWFLYVLSPFGPAAPVIAPSGIAQFYRSASH